MTPQKRFEFMKLKLTEDLAAILVEERGLSIENAFAVLYRSQTYARLSDPATKLITRAVAMCTPCWRKNFPREVRGKRYDVRGKRCYERNRR